MHLYTTNYFNTFIEVAEDTPTQRSIIPPQKEKKTIARIQYELIANNPYKYTSDDILFLTFAIRNNVPHDRYKSLREGFFSKGQPCLRTSPLAKSYGFGIHCDSKGKVAIYGMETPAYRKFITDQTIKKLKAMRSKSK
ncbi:MAG: hypothetical protein KatS3mg032_1996 [Cyclobacteriaceae bacterium]|nr:MAG: hypothetical protein KatS3mg032_1996 [Cyclobacteriaceae bacterium]